MSIRWLALEIYRIEVPSKSLRSTAEDQSRKRLPVRGA
jgi:hypothetical protein